MPITTLRFKIIRLKKRAPGQQREVSDSLQPSAFKRDMDLLLNSDAIPYVVAPILFLLWVGLQWWHWHQQTLTSPLPLTLLALGLMIYCFHKLSTVKKRRQDEKTANINQYQTH